ncbi:MAG: hypothetical protein WB621_06710 [Candidatus Acidiferrales bacterium]
MNAAVTRLAGLPFVACLTLVDGRMVCLGQRRSEIRISISTNDVSPDGYR